MTHEGRKETSAWPLRLGVGWRLPLAGVVPPFPVILVAVVHFGLFGRPNLGYKNQKRWASIISVHLETQISAIRVAEILCSP